MQPIVLGGEESGTARTPATAREGDLAAAGVVAYGVHHKYFRDTSYGATDYNHRDVECRVTGTYYSYVFFKDHKNIYWDRKDRTFTSAELEAQGGWPDWARDDDWNNWFYDKWTKYPPFGCSR